MKTFKLPKPEPLIDLASQARGGAREAARHSYAHFEHIRLRANCAPEVMVNVLSPVSSDLKVVGWHFDYIGRQGDLALESDDGYQPHGWGRQELIDDWGLDLAELRPQSSLNALSARKLAKLAPKLVFSLSERTLQQRVLSTVCNFAREELHGRHCCAMVLHTDEPHPHVHLVLRAVSEDGRRLNVMQTTQRAVRGADRKPSKDEYLASLRGESTPVRTEAEGVSRDLAASGSVRPEAGRQTLLATRAAVQVGRRSVAETLVLHGDRQFAADVARFARRMDRPMTERESNARLLSAHARAQQQEVRTFRQPPPAGAWRRSLPAAHNTIGQTWQPNYTSGQSTMPTVEVRSRPLTR